MASGWSVPSEELSCPVCQDIFTDPVLLPCSHSFCHACVLEWWRTKRIRECPVCKTVSRSKSPPRSLVLKNLCEAFLLEVESGLVCRLHTEKLKLFCLDHRIPVCLVCRDSVEHRNHRFLPVDEAAELHRKELRRYLNPLQEKLKLFNEVKLSCEKTEDEIKKQAQDTEEKLREKFRELREFLRVEENVRIVALRREEERKRKMMTDTIDVMSREINTLESTMKTIEAGLSDDDLPFLLKLDAVNRDAQRPLPVDPEHTTGTLIDVAKYLGNLSFKVWSKMKTMVSYIPVTLNPNTAHRELHLSECLTSVRCGPKQPLVATSERMEQHRCVLGSEGFSSGIHSWDVDVGNNTVWALGVIAQNALKTGDTQSGLWMVRFCNGKFTAFSPLRPMSVLPLKEQLQRVRVHLDYNKGKLSFMDPDRNTPIHAFTHIFTDILFPYINTWNDLPVTVLPANVSVTITEP